MIWYIISISIGFLTGIIGIIYRYGRLNEKVERVEKLLDNHLAHTDVELTKMREELTTIKEAVAYIRGCVKMEE